MAAREPPEPVKALVGLLGRDPGCMEQALFRLQLVLGPVDLLGEAIPFEHTSYYEPEMGPDLVRRIASFERLIDPGTLADLKNLAARIETELSQEGRRQVNLDPGYLDFNKLVLASYKPGGQKVYLRDGVYADIVLLYAKGRFEPFCWTFPDFAQGTHEEILLAVRRKYRTQRRDET